MPRLLFVSERRHEAVLLTSRRWQCASSWRRCMWESSRQISDPALGNVSCLEHDVVHWGWPSKVWRCAKPCGSVSQFFPWDEFKQQERKEAVSWRCLLFFWFLLPLTIEVSERQLGYLVTSLLTWFPREGRTNSCGSSGLYMCSMTHPNSHTH